MGKELHAKFRIMDIRQLSSLVQVQTAAPVSSPAPTAVLAPPLATTVTVPARADPAPAPRPTSVVATQAAPSPSIDKATPLPAEPEAKPEMTVTSDPTGAAVEINGVAVGTTPVTVALAKGTKFELAVRKQGYVPWIATSTYEEIQEGSAPDSGAIAWLSHKTGPPVLPITLLDQRNNVLWRAP